MRLTRKALIRAGLRNKLAGGAAATLEIQAPATAAVGGERRRPWQLAAVAEGNTAAIKYQPCKCKQSTVPNLLDRLGEQPLHAILLMHEAFELQPGATRSIARSITDRGCVRECERAVAGG